ncbi:MAG: hypothetical protein Q9217_000461 [Psora testacea]
MDDELTLLERDYCPPIDSSLFYAIISDYDHADDASLAELRTILEALRESAALEEAAQFDPSGSSGVQDGGESQSSSERAKSWHGDVASTSEYTDDTDLTGVSQVLNAALPENGELNGATCDMDYEELSVDEKFYELRMMFPSAKDYDIAYTLQKVDNSFNRALEELLNVVSLEEEGEQTGEKVFYRGVEGFSEPAARKSGRRRKAKHTAIQRRASSTPALLENKTNNSPSPSSRWDRAKEHVEFVAARTHIAPATITSLYHKNGASLPAIIAAICRFTDVHNPYLSNISPSLVDTRTADLAIEYPSLRRLQARALVQLTYPSTASARELARALASSDYPSLNSQILPQYLPRPSSLIETESKVSTSSMQTFPANTTATLAATRSTAFSQAASAYRLSKSRPLMGGAAAYYSTVGRDASAALRQHEAAEARALVTGQSKSGEVDLHGVSVRDAVSIARERVEEWWERDGREWARGGKVRGRGLRIVTGRGQHSEGGKGRLGPAVGGMLVREGWKVEIGQGVIDMIGRARR